MRTSIRLPGALAVAVLSLATPALAQYNAPIRYHEGPGYKVSDGLVFHPGLAIEGRYDSNALYEDQAPDAAGYMRFIGHLHLSTLPPQRLTDGEGRLAPRKVDFRLKTAVSFREYLSDSENVKAQRALEVDAGLAAILFPEGVFSVEFADDFARTVTARYQETTDTLNRDTNRAAVRFKVAPGGGRLSFGLGYALNLDFYEDASLAGANKLYHEISFGAKWKILPKTAVTFDAIEQIHNYYDRSAGIFSNVGLQKGDSKPLRLYAGLVGLITTKLSTLLRLGYGNGFSDKGPSYNNILAQAELGYQFSLLAKFKLGYEHLFQDSIVASYFTDDLVYLGYDHLIASRVLLHARADYRYRQHSGLSAAINYPELVQNLITLSLGADYQIKDWVYVGLGYDLQVQSRIKGPTDSSGAFSPKYTKHQVFAKVGVSY